MHNNTLTKAEAKHIEQSLMDKLGGQIHCTTTEALHGLIENGNSFRNNAKLERQYNKFRNKYWKTRSLDFL